MGWAGVTACDIPDQRVKVDADNLHVFRSGLQAAQRHHIRNQARKAQDLMQHDAIIPLPVLFVPHHPIRQRFQQATNRRKRSAQFVGNVRHIFAPHGLQALHLRHILKQAHHANALSAIRYHGSYGDPKRFISGHRIGKGLWFARFVHFVKSLPNLWIWH